MIIDCIKLPTADISVLTQELEPEAMGELFHAIICYATIGKEINFVSEAGVVWPMVKMWLDIGYEGDC